MFRSPAPYRHSNGSPRKPKWDRGASETYKSNGKQERERRKMQAALRHLVVSRADILTGYHDGTSWGVKIGKMQGWMVSDGMYSGRGWTKLNAFTDFCKWPNHG